MPILDKVLGVAEAARDKLKETFGDPTDSVDDADGSSPDAHTIEAALDVAGAYALLGLGENATLAEVRDAYRAKAKQEQPRAVRDGDTSPAAQRFDRLLEALELLEEHLVPLSGMKPATHAPSKPEPPKRKRATERKS